MSTTAINNTSDLLGFLVNQSKGERNWFGFQQQRIAGVDLAYQIALRYADKMTADQVVSYVVDLNNAIYSKLLKG